MTTYVCTAVHRCPLQHLEVAPDRLSWALHVTQPKLKAKRLVQTLLSSQTSRFVSQGQVYETLLSQGLHTQCAQARAGLQQVRLLPLITCHVCVGCASLVACAVAGCLSYTNQSEPKALAGIKSYAWNSLVSM